MYMLCETVEVFAASPKIKSMLSLESVDNSKEWHRHLPDGDFPCAQVIFLRSRS